MDLLPRAIVCLVIVLHFGIINASEKAQEFILCASLRGVIEHIAEDGGPEIIPTELPYQKCSDKYCYTLWQEDANNKTVIMGQGCWDASGIPNECDRSECLADKRPPKAMNNTKFCCCSENKCNVNFTDAYIPVDETLSEADPSSKEDINPLIYIGIAAVFGVLLVVTALVSYYCWKLKPKKSDIESGQNALPPLADYSLDKLKLLNVIGQGRYGCVWKGQIEDRELAVKVFPAHHRNYFLNEHEIYKNAGEHSALLKCFGGGEYIRVPGHIDYLLLLGLEQESLQEYLKNHTLDLATLCKMSLSIAKGLAHLHTDLEKPCIAHRDINSKNILVRADLSCCICDLGLAVIPKSAENKAISEAGTLRYMAPEVLEGAVNLRDCESALKQIDVYAMGLVLWELGIRCTDMQNSEPSPYYPPFYMEAGENPTLEQMQTLVSRRKIRPIWPVSWKDTVAARLLCETAEDCWDQDAEARLTSLCVVERFLELPSLKGRILHPPHPPSSPTYLINNNHLHDHQIDLSAATVETLLSPTEENCKNSNQFAICATPLQPYQGRNPCLERNLLTGSSDSLLIDKSSKHCTSSESQNLITNEFLNFQINHRATPIPYLQNAVYGIPKQQNGEAERENTTRRSRFKWSTLIKFLNSKKLSGTNDSSCKETQVKLRDKVVNNSYGQNGVTTSLLNATDNRRPSTLGLTVAKQQDSTNTCGVNQIIKRKNSLPRQKSLEQFTEVFSSTTDLTRLKDPAQRIKTPGDVPPSVRKTRGKAATDSARFSLYDDRIMGVRGQWGSAPDLEPPVPLKPPFFNDVYDRDSEKSIPAFEKISIINKDSKHNETTTSRYATLKKTNKSETAVGRYRFNDLPEERSTVLLLGVTRIPSSPSPQRRPCSLPVDAHLCQNSLVLPEQVRRSTFLTSHRRSIVRRNSSKRKEGHLVQQTRPHQPPVPAPTVSVTVTVGDPATQSSVFATTPVFNIAVVDVSTPEPRDDKDNVVAMLNADVKPGGSNLGPPMIMETSVDSIGTCSLDVDASVTDLSGWSDVTSLGTLRSKSIPSQQPIPIEPHLPSYLSLACTINGYSTTTNYDSVRLARSRDASPHRFEPDNLTPKKPSYSVQNNLLSPPNLVPLPTTNKMSENALAQHHHQKYYTNMKTVSYITQESHFTTNLITNVKDSIDGCIENGHHTIQSKCVSFENKNITTVNGESKCSSETILRQEFSKGKETKSFIQQRVERLYGPGALAQAFFTTKRQKDRLFESEEFQTVVEPEKHSKSLTDKLLDEEVEPTMKQSTSSPTLPVLRHLRPEFRAQLPIVSPRKGKEPSMQKSITVPKLKGEEVKVNGHSKLQEVVEKQNGDIVEHVDKQHLGEKNGHYFIKILDGQAERLLKLADSVEKDLTSNMEHLSEEVIGKLRSASGKARLLVSQKMQQFRGLCANNINQVVGEAFPTTNQDLQGFWDMVMLQVDQVDNLFKEITVLKQNNWKEVEVAKPETNAKGAVKPRKGASRPRPTTAVNEEVRKQREEQRKKMIEDRRRAMKTQPTTKSSIEIFVPESS